MVRSMEKKEIKSWILEVRGADPAEIVAPWLDTWRAKYPLVIVRGCQFDADSLLAFSNSLGTPVQKAHLKPVIELIPKVENTDRSGTFSSITSMQWHADRSFDENPPATSLLYGAEMGEGAGDTVWSNTHLAYEDLSVEMKKTCQKLKCRHELSKFAGSYDDPIYGFASPERQKVAFQRAQSVKDLVSHWEGRSYLNINRGYTSEILDADPSLLERLLAWVEDEKYQYRHKWKSGDLIIGNNNILIHARDKSQSEKRKSFRVLLK